jgi:hypothetical protein
MLNLTEQILESLLSLEEALATGEDRMTQGKTTEDSRNQESCREDSRPLMQRKKDKYLKR